MMFISSVSLGSAHLPLLPGMPSFPCLPPMVSNPVLQTSTVLLASWLCPTPSPTLGTWKPGFPPGSLSCTPLSACIWGTGL